MPVRESCIASYEMYTGYVLTIIKTYITFSYKIVEAVEPVNLYENNTAVATSALMPHGKRDTDSLRAP